MFFEYFQFCLLQDQTKRYLKDIPYCSHHSLQFKSTQIIVDFEQSLQEGNKRAQTDITIIRCRFHLAQT